MIQLKSFINKTKNISGFLGVAVVLAVTGVVCPLVYGFNDDAMMRSILSGAYLGYPDGHTVYMRYPLSGLLSLLYRITDAVPWFTLFFAGVLAGCVFILLKLVGESTRKISSRVGGIAFAAILLVMLLFPHYVVMHYTIMAAVFGGTALFILLGGEVQQGLTAGRKAVSLLLLLLCYMVRSQVFYMMIPFWGVAMLWKLAGDRKKEERKEGLKACGIYALELLLGVGLLIVINSVMYSSEEWKNYQAYNEARTELYDYAGILPYEEYQSVYEELGVSEEQYELLERYGIILDDKIDAELLMRLAKAAKEENIEQIGTKDLLVERAREYYYRTTHQEDAPYNYVVLALYALVFLCCVSHKHWIRVFLVFCLGAGRSIIWLYLMMRGRYPERVTVSLYLIEGLLLAGMFVGYLKSQKDTALGEKWTSILPLAGLVIGLVFCIPNTVKQVEKGYANAQNQESVQKEWEELRAYMGSHAEDFFYLDVYSVVSVTDVQYRAAEYENYMLLGGWMSKSALQLDKQILSGYSDPLKALTEGENAYLVVDGSRMYDWIEEYAKSVGYKLEFTLYDQVGRFNIYHAK